MSDPFQFFAGFTKIPLPKIILLTKYVIIATGIATLMDAFFIFVAGIDNISVEQFLLYSISGTFLIFSVVALIAIFCAYLYKPLKKILED